MEKGVDPDQLVSQKKPADLDLPCLQEKIIVGISGTWDNDKLLKYTQCLVMLNGRSNLL